MDREIVPDRKVDRSGRGFSKAPGLSESLLDRDLPDDNVDNSGLGFSKAPSLSKSLLDEDLDPIEPIEESSSDDEYGGVFDFDQFDNVHDIENSRAFEAKNRPKF